jgi:outer membrane protein assembly factor BamB
MGASRWGHFSNTSAMIMKASSGVSLACIYLALMLVSCCKDEIEKYEPKSFVDFHWSKMLHEGTESSNSIIREHLVFGNLTIIATTDGIENRFISGVNIENGELLWKWNDIYQAPTEYFDIRYAYSFNNLMTYQVGSRSYCINLSDGTTEWKIRRTECASPTGGFCSFDSEICGLGNTYYTLGPPQDTLAQYEVQIGYKGNLLTGEVLPFLTPFFSGEYIALGNFLGGVTSLVPFVQNTDTMLVVTYAEATEGQSTHHIKSFLGLYNDTKDEWVYDRKLLTQPKWNSSVFHPPIIYKDLIVIQVGQGIVVHDLASGVRLWGKEDFKNDFLFSGLIVEDGVIYANNEDKNLYALDVRFGNLLWKEPTAGTSSRLRYLNGIVYLSGGSTGKIHAIDTETGETVWLLDPLKYEDGSDDFKPDLYVVPGENGEKGKVIIQTHNTAYCVEAYR